MRKDYSTPVVVSRSAARATHSGGQQKEKEKKRVDYSHLDIIAEVERIIGCSLKRHTRTSGKYTCQCPFPGCSSKEDAFLVFDRPDLEEGQVHYWCNRCNQRGSLLDLLKELKGFSFQEACEDLRIDTRTWRGIGAPDREGDEIDQQRATGSEKRRKEQEKDRKAIQTEIELLHAWYARARIWLASGHIAMQDGRLIEFDRARAYLAERGISLEQAAQLELAYVPTITEYPEIANVKELAAWRGRILFPLAGPKNALGYAGRSLFLWKPGISAELHKKRMEAWNKLHPDQRVERYYKTRQVAYYGYEQACQVRRLIIVEGEFDAASIRLAIAGLEDIAVCAYGKSFQARQVPLNVLSVLLAFDGDQAGQEAIAHQVEELEARGVSVEVVRPTNGKDWNDMLVAGLAEEMRTLFIPAQLPEPTDEELLRELLAAALPPLCSQCLDENVETVAIGETEEGAYCNVHRPGQEVQSVGDEPVQLEKIEKRQALPEQPTREYSEALLQAFPVKFRTRILKERAAEKAGDRPTHYLGYEEFTVTDDGCIRTWPIDEPEQKSTAPSADPETRAYADPVTRELAQLFDVKEIVFSAEKPESEKDQHPGRAQEKPSSGIMPISLAQQKKLGTRFEREVDMPPDPARFAHLAGGYDAYKARYKPEYRD